MYYPDLANFGDNCAMDDKEEAQHLTGSNVALQVPCALKYDLEKSKYTLGDEAQTLTKSKFALQSRSLYCMCT